MQAYRLRSVRLRFVPRRLTGARLPAFRSLHQSSTVRSVEDERTEEELISLEQAKKEREIRAADEKRMQESKTLLAKWMRHDAAAPERERLKAMADQVRELYPDRAQAADEFIKSLDTGVILQHAQKLFPEFAERNLKEEDVFDVLTQFLPDKDKPAVLMKARERMEKETKEAAAKRKADLAETDTFLKSVYKDFPSLPDDLKSDGPTRDDTLDIDEEDVVQSNEDAMQELVRKLKTHEMPAFLTREEFMAGIDKSNLNVVRAREEQWAKYQEQVHAARTHQAIEPKADKTADEEPIIEAAGNFDRLFTQATIGKYIRWNEREQKKYIPEGWGGKLEKREFEITKETSLLLRPDTLKAINKLDQARAASFTRKAPKPIVLTGERGVGKSAILQQVVYWARKSDWLVFNIKSGLKWTQSGGRIQKSTIMPGCWDQPTLAATMLSYFLSAHTDKLKHLPLRTNPTILDFSGTTLYDLVEFGAALPEFATECLVHLRHELTRVIEYPVLIAIDDYNELYNYSQTWRNPEFTKFKPEKLQNRHLTLTNLFLDCHRDPKLINGTFIGALSLELTLRHFDIDAQRGDNPDWIEVQPYSLDEINRVMAHYRRTQTIYADMSTGTNAVLHQITSGNPYDISKWTAGL